MVRAENIFFTAGKKTLLHQTSVAFEEGKFHVIMGANGAGKSTLLKILSGNISPTSGKVLLQDKELETYSQRELSLKRAVLSQHYHLSFPVNVDDVVMMGRYPHYGNTPADKDIAICKEALALMEMESFSDRDYTTLSGGEAQKVQMSRVLAQIWNKESNDKKVLFLDEPVSSLDVKYQYQLMRLAKECCKENITVISILHDINLAIAFGDRLLFMKEGEIKHELNNPDAITAELIKDTFGVPSSIMRLEDHPKPVVVF
jgi:iron complex transport system ATP-binding protein